MFKTGKVILVYSPQYWFQMVAVLYNTSLHGMVWYGMVSHSPASGFHLFYRHTPTVCTALRCDMIMIVTLQERIQ